MLPCEETDSKTLSQENVVPYVTIKLVIKPRHAFGAQIEQIYHFPSGVLRDRFSVSHGKSTHDPSRQRREAASFNMEEEIPSLEELKKLKVVELKARLSSLGLQTSGRLGNNSFLCLRLN